MWGDCYKSNLYFSIIETSRDQPKSAPYPRPKNSKKTSKCQVFSFTLLENRKFFENFFFENISFRKNYILKKMDRVARRGPLARAPGALKGGHCQICEHFCRSWRGNPLEKKQIFGEKSHSAEKNWKGGGPFGIFQHPFCRKTAKKLKGGLFEEKKFRKKSLAVPKKIGRGDPLVSLGMVCYAGKQEKPFWFSSLDQIVQFGAIIFCRTFKNCFGQFVWIEKKRKPTIIVAFHFMKRWLKINMMSPDTLTIKTLLSLLNKTPIRSFTWTQKSSPLFVRHAQFTLLF